MQKIMALDLDSVKRAMEEYIGSEAHKKQMAQIEHRQTLKKRNNEYLRKMSAEERCDLITKIYNKYNSEQYKERELKLGYYEPRYTLYDVIFDYAVEYGLPSLYNINDYFPEEQYDIDGKFVIGEINGQGSFIYLTSIQENEIIPHEIRNIETTIFNPEGKKVITTVDPLVFNDIRIQIKNKKLTGYYVIFKGTKYEIKSNGKIDNWPRGLFDTEVRQLAQILKQV